MARAIGMPNFTSDDKSKAVAKGGKVGKVLHEFKAGDLHSGSKSGPPVKSKKQAVAIGLSEARKAVGVGQGARPAGGLSRRGKKVGVGQGEPMSPPIGTPPIPVPGQQPPGMPMRPPGGMPMRPPSGMPMPAPGAVGGGQSVGVGQSTGTAAMAAQVKPSYAKSKKKVGKGSSKMGAC